METEKAKALNEFVTNAIHAFDNFIKDIENRTSPDPNEMKKYGLARFEEKFQDFLDEFEANVRKYRNKYLIRDYTISCFTLPRSWNGFDFKHTQKVIKLGIETEFMLGLIININTYNDIMMCYFDLAVTDKVRSLNYNYDQIAEDIEDNDCITFKKSKTNIIPKEDRFDFNFIQSECRSLDSYTEKIKLINERLFDFEQWQIQCDNLITDRDVGQYYEYTVKYYNDFERLCNIELCRLEKLLEIEQRLPSSADNIPRSELSKPHFKWTASETDLLELVTAMHLKKTIERRDGKLLTRKELIETFEDMFHFKIKDPEGKLNKATNRKINTTPFLDSLKAAFESYVEDKDEKQRKRR